MSIGEAALPLIPYPMEWHGQGRDTHLPPHPLLPIAGRRPGPGVMKTEELVLPFTYCNTWEGWLCTFVPHLGSTRQLNLVTGAQQAGHATCLLCGDMGKGEIPPALCHLWRQESFFCPSSTSALGRVGPAHHLENRVKLALDAAVAGELAPRV